MSVVFATYDLRRPGQAWAEMDKALKELGGARALQTVWFFPPGRTRDEVITAINRVSDGNDGWFVGVVSGPAGWNNLEAAWTSWFQSHL